MATYTALHVQTTDDSAVQAALTDWLRSSHHAEPLTRQLEEFPFDFYGEAAFMASEEELPTRLVIMRYQPDWLTVHFNSFAELDDLTRELSALIDSRAVTILAQSVTDAYFLLVYDSGRHVRTLEWVGESGEWLRDEGAPLPFEASPLGRNISAEGEDPFYVFARDEVEDYCRHLGLRIWSDEEPAAVEIAVPRHDAPARAERRPWWRFWK